MAFAVEYVGFCVAFVCAASAFDPLVLRGKFQEFESQVGRRFGPMLASASAEEDCMITDPIADLLVRLGNAASRRQDVVKVPVSKVKRQILNILGKEGFIQGYGEMQVDGHPFFSVQLRYVEETRPMITGMRRISKPGRRVYVGRDDVPKVRNGIGVAVISTSKGLMTDSESRRSGLGGEVLCSVW